jgi:hypothetical protein
VFQTKNIALAVEAVVGHYHASEACMNRSFHFHYQTKTFPTPFTIFSILQNTFIIFYLQPLTQTNRENLSFEFKQLY